MGVFSKGRGEKNIYNYNRVMREHFFYTEMALSSDLVFVDPLEFGKTFVQCSFNPSGSSDVYDIKMMGAEMIAKAIEMYRMKLVSTCPNDLVCVRTQIDPRSFLSRKLEAAIADIANATMNIVGIVAGDYGTRRVEKEAAEGEEDAP